MNASFERHPVDTRPGRACRHGTTRPLRIDGHARHCSEHEAVRPRLIRESADAVQASGSVARLSQGSGSGASGERYGADGEGRTPQAAESRALIGRALARPIAVAGLAAPDEQGL